MLRCFGLHLSNPIVLTLVVTACAWSTAGTAQAQSTTPSPVAAQTTPEYRIGVDDVIAIAVRQAPELNTSTRVAVNGTVALPLIGDVAAASLTVPQLKTAIETALRARFIREPDVTVLVTEVRSQGVSVLGAVRKPGVHQIQGAATLLEVLSLAGGLGDDAGDEAHIRRVTDPQSPERVVKLGSLFVPGGDANVTLQPGDVVTVRPAGLVYVMGAINKPGAYTVRGNGGVTVLRALAYGEGVTPMAASRDAVVLRTNTNGERSEIPIDLDKVLKGKAPDVALQPQDVLFVPVSGGKTAGRATLDILARVLVRGLIW